MNYREMVIAYNKQVRDALQFLYDSITAQGQRKKLLKNAEVLALFDRYGVQYKKDL